MNEELKIIISAVTETAKKNIDDVKKKLGGLEKEGGKSSAGLGKSFKAIGVAAGVAVGAIMAVGAALVALGNNTRQFREEQARLNAAFLAAGSTTEQAAQSYSNLYRFLGDSGKATEAAGHLAKLTTNEKELAEWTTALQGVYASFGDSLPIEGLTEAANETAKVGKVTGGLADALNWAGVSEDAFNASLAACTTEQERQALIRDTLNGLYSDAAMLYEKNNADIIAANEAQARLDMTTARLGKTVQPLLTALSNLANTLLTALAPAIEVVSNALTWLVNAVSKAVQWITSLLGLLGGKGATTALADSVSNVSSGISGIGAGAGAVADGLKDATGQAEKLKKVTAGFDELNVLPSQESSGSGDSGASTGGGIGAIGGGTTIDTSGIEGALDKTSGKVEQFAAKVKAALEKLKVVFAPTIKAFKDLGAAVSGAIKNALPDFQAGAEGILSGLGTVFTYLIDEFIPSITNSFSTNIVPIFSDILSFAIEELGKDFSTLGEIFQSVSEEIITPALQSLETVTNDIFEGIKKAWDESGGELLANLSTFFEGLREDLQEFYEEVILPIWQKIQQVFDKVWTEGLKPLWDEVVLAATEIGACLLQLYNEFIKPIVDWIQEKIYPIIVKVVNWIVEKVGNAITTISNVIQGIVRTIKGIVQFITGIFTGDWEKAWEGVKNIFGGIWDTLVGLVKTPLNKIIDFVNSLISKVIGGINKLIRGINSISVDVPDWLGGGTIGFNLKELSIPQIPKLATGGIVTSETLARIGEGGKKEAVLPLEQNTGWMDSLADKLAEKINTPSRIVLMVDGNELGYAAINGINGITKQTGQLQLKLI